MPLEVFMPFPNDEYNKGITLQEYAGSYWLISSRKTDDGRIIHDWCHPSRNKQPIEKSIPLKIKLGDSRQEAFNALAHFGKILK